MPLAQGSKFHNNITIRCLMPRKKALAQTPEPFLLTADHKYYLSNMY